MCKAVLLGTAITTLSWMLPLPGADLQDPCQATPNSDDVQLTLSLDHHEPVFHPGEVIPLVLSFHSTRANDYQVRIQNSDRSGRLAVDTYCLDGAWSDPLHRYFGSWSGGMMGGLSFLQTPPASVQTQLNEWKTPGPGHHRLFVVSLRVEPRDRRAPSREGEAPSQVVVRSNAIEFEVGPPDPEWALQELRAAREALRAARPASADRIAAVRRVRFLQSEEAARELPRLWALYPDQELSSNFLFGAWSSPFPEIVVQSMKAALAMPDGTVTSAFLHTLAKIDSLLADRDGDGFRLSLHAAFQTTMEALARKTSHARALTVGEIFWMPPEGEEVPFSALLPALRSAWPDLDSQTQWSLLEYRWKKIGTPELAPILRKWLADHAREGGGSTRSVTLRRLVELDPALGRDAISAELRDEHSQPSIELVALLPRNELDTAVEAAVHRAGETSLRDLDAELIDRYADGSALGVVRSYLAPRTGQIDCAQQAALLRYLLRVAPDEGAARAKEALASRTGTGCFSGLLFELGPQLAPIEPLAIEAMDDPDHQVVEGAIRALGKWGGPAAEAALWERLQRRHAEKAERGMLPAGDPEWDRQEEFCLITAIATGTHWTAGPAAFARLEPLLVSSSNRDLLASWRNAWRQPAAVIEPQWIDGECEQFQVLQYGPLDAEGLRERIRRLPREIKVQWKVDSLTRWVPEVTVADQEACYARFAALGVERGSAIGKVER